MCMPQLGCVHRDAEVDGGEDFLGLTYDIHEVKEKHHTLPSLTFS